MHRALWLAITMAALPAMGHAASQTIWLPAEQLLMQAPAGWTLQADLGAEQVRLVSAQGSRLLLRAWNGARPGEAEQVAAEYEAYLQARGEGSRETQEPFTTDEGREGLLVTGNWAGPPEAPQVRAFAALGVGYRRLALALACAPEQLAEGLEELRAAARSLRTSEPPEALLPPAPSPTPSTPPAPLPETPAPAAHPVAPRQAHWGLSLPVPEGWEASLREGVAWVSDPADPPTGYFLWPVRVLDPALSAQELVAAWQQAAGVQLALRPPRELEQGWLAAGTAGEAPPARVVLHIGRQEQAALLQGFLAPTERWAQHASHLAALLAQVQAPGWQARAPETPRGWEDSSGLLKLDLPPGWQAQGAVRAYHGEPAVALTLLGEGVEIRWRQPATPAFRELTPILRSAGEVEGNLYRESAEEDHLRILSRREPAQFVEYLLQQPAEGFLRGQVQEVTPTLTAARLLGGVDSQGALVRVRGERAGEPRELLCLVAVAGLPVTAGAFRWQAAYLAVEYALEQQPQALSRLRAVVEGAEPSSAQAAEGAALAPLLAGAREALSALPSPAAEQSREGGFAPLLEADYAPVAPDAAPWSVSELLREWRRLAAGVESDLPELAPAWWE